jgi:hypothetical protein
VPSAVSRQPVAKTVLGAGSLSSASRPPRAAASQTPRMSSGLTARCQRTRRRRGGGAVAISSAAAASGAAITVTARSR